MPHRCGAHCRNHCLLTKLYLCQLHNPLYCPPGWAQQERGLPVPASLAALPLLAQPRTAPPASPPPALPNGLAIPSFISVPLVSPRTLA